ncbi:MAG: DPP IV N-terminal domain-containing protein, partial [candidate division NC10 bacterium]
MFRTPLLLLALVVLALTCLVGWGSAFSAPAGNITARQLVQPGALVGPGPENLQWSPKGARLAYTLAADSGDVLWLYEASTGDMRVLLDPAGKPDEIDVTSAQWSPAGDAMLLAGAASLWVLDVASGQVTKVAAKGSGAIDAMMFTPTGASVSYARGNDLYVTRLRDGRVRRVTFSGSQAVFNGCLDWVYNEELATRAAQPGYAWSPDGDWLMYMRLDDSRVHNDPVTDYRTVPPTVTYTRYPTAGTPNPVVSLHYLAADRGAKARGIPLPKGAEYVLPFYTWAPDSSEVFSISVNRAHTVLKLNAFDPARSTGRTVITETDPAWVNEDYYAAPVFLPDGKRFLWLSERSGYMHLYLYSIKGKLIRQLTDGDWLIDTTPYGILTAGRPVYVDPAGAWAYFNTTANSPLERQLYRLNIDSGQLEQLSHEAGFHEAALSGDGKYLVDQFCAVDTPPVTSILKADGSEVAELGRCAGPSLDLPRVSREFLTVKAQDGVELYAQIVKPEGFDPGKKYPVVIHWYGGPGLQLVSNRYGTTNIFNLIERDTLYTQAGFIVWRLDNRGSFG